MKQQRGFTLIELVVVIVILGILAAVALPRFVNLTADARGGVMRGVEAAMQGADTMIYAKAAAAGIANTAAGAGVQVAIGGGVNVLTNFGYARDVVELNRALALTPVGDFTVTLATNDIRHSGAVAPANCRITYAAAAAAGATPTYTRDISNC